MKILDTDTLTHHIVGHPKVLERQRQETDLVATTIISRIEILRGRFAMILTAAAGQELQRAQRRLDEAMAKMAGVPIVVPIDEAAANEFDRLRENKKLKKIGRADLLIASIALANRATLVTRNLKDFRLVPGLQVENWVD